MIQHRDVAPEPAPDHELVRRVAQGQQQALGELYDRYGAASYGLALRITRNRETAEEVVQDAFTRLWRHAGRFDGDRGRVGGWLMGITHNLAIDEVRRTRSRPQLDGTSLLQTDGYQALGGTGSVEHDAAVRLELQATSRALQELPEAQRAVIELAFLGGLTQNEIALHLQEPLGTIKTRMRLGLQKLRSQLAEDGQ